jgi:hypothetical protein
MLQRIATCGLDGLPGSDSNARMKSLLETQQRSPKNVGWLPVGREYGGQPELTGRHG